MNKLNVKNADSQSPTGVSLKKLGEKGENIAITPTGQSAVVIDFGVEPESKVKYKAIPKRE